MPATGRGCAASLCPIAASVQAVSLRSELLASLSCAVLLLFDPALVHAPSLDALLIAAAIVHIHSLLPFPAWSPAGAKALAELLERPSCQRTALDLSGNDIQDSGGEAPPPRVIDCSCIYRATPRHDLSLMNRMCVLPSAGKALALALEANAAQSRLQSLNLYNNALADGTAIAFGSTLRAQGRALSNATVIPAAADGSSSGDIMATAAAGGAAAAAAGGNADSSSSGRRGLEGGGEADCSSALRGLRCLVLAGKGNTFGVQGVTSLARSIAQDAGEWLEKVDLSSFTVSMIGSEEEVAAAALAKKGKKEGNKKKKEKGAAVKAVAAELQSMLRSAAELWERRHHRAGEKKQQAAAGGRTLRSKTTREMLLLQKVPDVS